MSTTASTFVLFGATGDLAARMLLPSLYHLHRDGLLQPTLNVLGLSRSTLSQADFAAHVERVVREFVPVEFVDTAALDGLIRRCRYESLDASSEASFAALRGSLGSAMQRTYYLSTAPDLYEPVCHGLAATGLISERCHVVLEKPIGKDLTSARAVNGAVQRYFAEDRIFRVDHYLGKEPVQNLLALRFGNALFEPLWSSAGIEHVQITVAETVGAEGRWDYYDRAGALRDMIQNHLLQLLALVAMEPPVDFDPNEVRNEKVKVLRSLRPIDAGEIIMKTVGGQYTAGAAQGQPVPGYLQEPGARADSRTETFVALRAEVDNWRWKGVPFYLRTGKRMATRSTEIVIQFRSVPHNIFDSHGAPLQPNKMVIRMQPQETITLSLMGKQPGLNGMRLSPVALNLSLTEAFKETRRRQAHERLILDALAGNTTLFVRSDEVEAAWRWVDHIADGWRQANIAPKPYPAGTWGPAAAIALPERFGHSWHD
jgi:glucose-6-phosphate 1-dehydrogenase